MTAVTERRQRAKESLINNAVQRVKYLLRLIARELRPEAPRKRLLRRCRKSREDR
ncbi:hypothetical protein KDX38_12730 [Pseudomonas sp. CDFA 602]|uniref:hypothetical protein n=1 Tax=Pseudomonas californiensis TaxID=2829823 RepID=UPI001E59A92A|nr:hypothetical protein [Pseudomonas californiensis]MCD5994557.1 hypothetical protein [Pseudomonas californiensis]MCD6000081.1 hypothetical protein [Pseudomonas californiensis]